MSENTEVATRKPTTLKTLLLSESIQRQIALALPKHMTAERMCRVALTAMLRTPKLASCSQESFMQAMLTLSQMGLEPDGRHAHLIPYGKECQPIADYKGLVQLALRSDQVAKIHADVVCENDEFEYDLGAIKKHKINFRRPRGDVFAVYALCEMKDGSVACEVLSKIDVEKVRSRSRAGSSGPWVSDWNEMAKKTAFRRLSKWLPMSSEYRDAVDLEDGAAVQIDQSQVLNLEQVGTKSDRTAAMLEDTPANSDTVSEPTEPDPIDPDATPSQVAAFENILNRISNAKHDVDVAKAEVTMSDAVETDTITQPQFLYLRDAAIAKTESFAPAKAT
jgi:recombination protein RecT